MLNLIQWSFNGKCSHFTEGEKTRFHKQYFSHIDKNHRFSKKRELKKIFRLKIECKFPNVMEFRFYWLFAIKFTGQGWFLIPTAWGSFHPQPPCAYSIVCPLLVVSPVKPLWSLYHCCYWCVLFVSHLSNNVFAHSTQTVFFSSSSSVSLLRCCSFLLLTLRFIYSLYFAMQRCHASSCTQLHISFERRIQASIVLYSLLHCWLLKM